MTPSVNGFFAFISDYKGQIIQEIIFPENKLSNKATKSWSSFYDVVADKEHSRLETFISSILSENGVQRANFTIKDGSSQPLIFIGAKFFENILIIGGDIVYNNCYRLFEEMIIINNEQTNIVRNKAKELSTACEEHHKSQNEFYTELMITNNELANAQRLLAKKNAELEEINRHIEALSGILPICSGCKKIRNKEGFWEQIENFISNHSKVAFSHSVCPECYKDLYPETETDK